MSRTSPVFCAMFCPRCNTSWDVPKEEVTGARCDECGSKLQPNTGNLQENYDRTADRIDGYDRDDMGESPDY